MESPHSFSVVVVGTPKVFLILKGFDKSISFFGIRFFWGLVLPCPFVIVLFLLVCWFLGSCLLWGLFLGCRLGCWFRLGILSRCAAPFFLQRVDLGAHGHYFLLFLCGLTPHVFFVQETRFVLFSARIMRSSAVNEALPSSA